MRMKCFNFKAINFWSAQYIKLAYYEAACERAWNQNENKARCQFPAHM